MHTFRGKCFIYAGLALARLFLASLFEGGGPLAVEGVLFVYRFRHECERAPPRIRQLIYRRARLRRKKKGLTPFGTPSMCSVA